MIETLKGDELVKKVGGPFRLTALIQRRLKELIEGARPLVDSANKTFIEIAIQEIAEDKIVIDYDKSSSLNPPDLTVLDKEVRTTAKAVIQDD